MLNPLSTYADLGRRTARAVQRHDEGMAGFHRDWLRRALALEKPEDRPACRKAFDEAYREEAA